MSDADFDFSDDDLDDLPATAIEQFEAAAIRATQQPRTAAASDYGLDDDDEVINLDDDNITHLDDSNNITNLDDGDDITNRDNPDELRPTQLPRPSQADPDQLLARIKKVRAAAPAPAPTPALTRAAGAGQGPREARRRQPEDAPADKGRRG